MRVVRREQVFLHVHEHAGGRTATSTARSSATPVHNRVGKVTAISSGTMTVTTKRLGAVQLHLTSATTVERVLAGSAADVAVGRRVLIPSLGEVIVLPAGSSVGRLVASTAKGTFALAKAGRKGATKITDSKVKVETVSPAKVSDVKTGSQVIVLVRRVHKGLFDAVEVIMQ